MKIIESLPNSFDALKLMDELSDHLYLIAGNSGRNSFSVDDILSPGGLFVIALSEDNEPIGCGCFRKIDNNIAEVKRMYAKQKGTGIGSELLIYLEKNAKKMGYSKFWVETRLINHGAVKFYKKQGYQIIENYGKYKNNSEAICFEKVL